MAKNEKTFNEQNMRKIIRILSGLSASQQQLAEQCVNEYQADKTYSKDNICFYNGTLYRAKTVTLGNAPSPESTYFEMLDGVEEEIDAQYIETLMSTVSAETWDYMKNFINDDIISGTHGYSSSKIYTEIQNAIQTAKDYTLTQVANSSTGSYVIANGTDEVIDDKHLFLISNGSNYDIYALVSGAPTKIGDTSVSLNGLLTETTAESTYLKQADATATYATITTTDGLRTDLDNHTNNTVAHLTQEEKDKLVTTDVLGDYAKTADLPTPRTDDEILAVINKEGLKFIDDANDTALTNGKYATKTTTTNLPVSAYGILTIDKYKDNNSTWIKQTYKPLANQIYVRSKINELDWTAWEIVITNKNETYKIKDYNNDLKVNNTITKLEDLLKLVPKGETWYIPDFNIDQTVTDFGFPEGMRAWGSMTITNSISSGHYLIELQTNNNYQFYKRWLGETKNGTAGSNLAYQVNWRQVCTTGVPDVDKTNITFSDETNYKTIASSSLNYFLVKNGICYVSLDVTVVSAKSDSWTTVCTLPKSVSPRIDICHSFVDEVSDSYIAYGVWEDGALKIKNGVNNTRYLCVFSYPVKES